MADYTHATGWCCNAPSSCQEAAACVFWLHPAPNREERMSSIRKQVWERLPELPYIGSRAWTKPEDSSGGGGLITMKRDRIPVWGIGHRQSMLQSR